MANAQSTDKDKYGERIHSRNREDTQTQLKLALHRLQRTRKKITIKAVAEEAGVTPALIHNRYPNFAEEIRRISGKSMRTQRDEKQDLLEKERDKNRTLRELLRRQLAEIRALASVNESLRVELAFQKAINSGKVAKGKFRRPTGDTF